MTRGEARTAVLTAAARLGDAHARHGSVPLTVNHGSRYIADRAAAGVGLTWRDRIGDAGAVGAAYQRAYDEVRR
jgi:hypothetical protein